jgi:hypothetical protein
MEAPAAAGVTLTGTGEEVRRAPGLMGARGVQTGLVAGRRGGEWGNFIGRWPAPSP